MADPILVTRSSMPPFDEYLREIEPLWESHWLTNMGEKHRQLEEDLKRDRKSTRLNSSHPTTSRMPSSA